MKKIIRFSLVLALSSAALLNTGCTKDFEKDLDAVRQDLKDFQGGTFQSVKDQVANLESQVANLKKVDETLTNNLANLEKTVGDLSKQVTAELATAKADIVDLKAADAAIKKDITSIQNDIKVLKSDKADKSWVESTYATLADQKKIQQDLADATTKINKVADDLGKLQVKEAEDVKKLNEAIEQTNKTLTEVSQVANAAKKLAEDNYKWLGDLQAYVDALYTNAQIDKKLGDLKDEVKEELETAKSELNKKISDLEKDLALEVLNRGKEDEAIRTEYKKADALLEEAYKKADEALKADYELKDKTLKEGLEKAIKDGDDALEAKLVKKIEEADSKLKEDIDKNTKAIDAIKLDIDAINIALGKCATKEELSEEIAKEAKAREEAITAASKTLQDQIDAINGKLSELAGRVSSISVYPMDEPEFQEYILGDQNSYVFNAQFVVRPSEKASTIKKEDLELAYAYGLDKGAAKQLKLDSLATVSYAGNLVTVKAFFHDGTIDKKPETVPYYALTYKGEDANGKYVVTSDYVEAKFAEPFTFDATTFYPQYMDNAKAYNSLTDSKNVEYNQIASYSDTPFAAYSLQLVYKLGNSLNATTPEIMAQTFGLAVNVTIHTCVENGEISGAPFKAADQANITAMTITGNTSIEDYSSFVGQSYTFGIDTITVNGIKYPTAPGVLPAFEGGYAKATYKVTRISRHIFDTVAVHWNYKNFETCVDTVTIVNTDWNNSTMGTIAKDFQFLTCPSLDAKPISLTLKSMKWGTVESLDSVVVGRTSASDTMTFHIAAIIKPAPVIDTVRRAAEDSLVFTIHNTDVINLPFVDDVITKAGGIEVFNKNLSGDAALSETVYKEFASALTFATTHSMFTVKVNGQQVNPTTVTVAADNLKLEFPANTFVYSEDYTVTINTQTFGVKYVYEYTFSTKKSPYVLMPLPYLVETEKGLRGEVRGNFVGGVYTLNDMYFAKYLRVFGNIPADEAEYVKVSVTPSYETKPGATGAIDYDGTVVLTAIDVDNEPIPGTNEYSLDNEVKVKWGTYTGREVYFKAQLTVDGVPVGKPVYFTLWTAKPVEFANIGLNRAERKAATPQEFHINKEVVVYGVEEGQLVTTRNIVNQETGEFIPEYSYPGTKFNYRYDLMTAKVNDKAYTLVPGVDYQIIDNDTDQITLIGDNCVGKVEITIPVELEYYLDYSHTAVETLNAQILLNQ